jgi:hypothetical protein
MEQLRVQRPRADKSRSRSTWLALGTCALTLAIATRADAQPLDSRPPPAAAHRDNPRRARTVSPDRGSWAKDAKRDYADALEVTSLIDGQVDTALLEGRIRDLSAKVRELNDLVQRQKEAAEPVRFVPRPMRLTLLEQHRPRRVAKTYGEALAVVARDRARAISATFNNADERARLAIDPDPAEVRRLLEPIDAWLAASGTPAENAYASLQALVYATLLEARAKINCPEPLPLDHKLLRDLHIDRRGLTEHLRRSFLLDQPPGGRDLGAVLAATAMTYPEPSGMREFLTWIAESVGSDLKDELARMAVYSYRSDAGGQFGAAAENAMNDNGDVLKLQVELQRMLVEAKALRAARRASESTAGTWQHRLLQAERELDRLVRAADSEREAVMTLARRVPVDRDDTAAAAPALESLTIESAEEVASDDLTTQH